MSVNLDGSFSEASEAGDGPPAPLKGFGSMVDNSNSPYAAPTAAAVQAALQQTSSSSMLSDYNHGGDNYDGHGIETAGNDEEDDDELPRRDSLARRGHNNSATPTRDRAVTLENASGAPPLPRGGRPARPRASTADRLNGTTSSSSNQQHHGSWHSSGEEGEGAPNGLVCTCFSFWFGIYCTPFIYKVLEIRFTYA